jgi:hypothetical protein
MEPRPPDRTERRHASGPAHPGGESPHRGFLNEAKAPHRACEEPENMGNAFRMISGKGCEHTVMESHSIAQPPS